MNATSHQATEYTLALLLVYGALHSSDGSSAVLFGLAAALALVAAVSPGRLGWRSWLGRRSRRVMDALLAAAVAAAAVAVTRDEWSATIVLVITALVLGRLALSPKPAAPPPPTPRSSRLDAVQPKINQAARVAGVFVRNRRAKRNS
jgi:hypothetical protein